MATYIISDPHGDRIKFYQLLKELRIALNKDVLVINGDIVDRGKDSLRLLFEILELRRIYGNEHVKITKGNHELFLSYYLDGTIDEDTYGSYGSQDTIREVNQLDTQAKERLKSILDELPLYEVVYSVKRAEDVVIVHTGLHPDFLLYNDNGTINVIKSIEKAAEFNEKSFLINDYIQMDAPEDVIRSLDKTLCIGHVPTPFIPEIEAPLISFIPGGKVILTDCGAGYGDKLGCLRLEDESTYYI